MQNHSSKTGASKAPFREQPPSPNVDIRCALTLARIALQTLADLNPEAASTIDNALAHEIAREGARKDPETLAVIAILKDVRARLAGEDMHSIGDDSAWYID